MEEIKEAVKRFLTVSYNYGYGYGYGDGRGDCFCCGNGRGHGRGGGSESDWGDGSGDGYGYGGCEGTGYDNDWPGSGKGCGYGSGDGDGLKSFNGDDIHYIDGIPTVIEEVRGNLARGYIVNGDLTKEKCFVAKHGRLFAHGETARGAIDALQIKIFGVADVEEKIEMFVKEFKSDKKYTVDEFQKWHSRLTGSCDFGRKAFLKNHEYNLDDKYTVKEFIEATKYDYGGKIIERLEEYYD